ncbi:hypothetical protein G9A89_022466 [Geosiphon pyriformis]|nr:hypothetical protein G9A89_022466 [Geosiphon pyriformis]
MTKLSGKKKEQELSEVLKKWLEPRIRPKLAAGLSLEQAWEDIVKDIVIKALSPLPLNVFAGAIQRLQELDENSRLALVEKLLTISPNPECAPPDRAERIRNTLLSILSPQNGSQSSNTSIEIDQDFINMIRTVLEHSHRDWASARDVLQRFLKNCTSKFNSDRNVYILYPCISKISRDVFRDIYEQKTLSYFYACMQELAAAKGFKLLDLVKTNISKDDNVHIGNFIKIVFPKGIPNDPEIKDLDQNDEDSDEGPRHKFSLRPRVRYRLPQQIVRPRWHNQQQMLLRTLLEAPSHILPRTELITRALAKDAEMSAREGLPRCFMGQTPKNSASACLTTNADKYFIPIKQDGATTSFYKLSFIPGDLDDAIATYNKWMKRLTEHDWPLCFGKTKKSKPGTELIKSPRAVVLSVGASNEKHLRCRRCGPELRGCDMKLPSCTRCKTKGILCVYPMRAGVQKELTPLKDLYTPKSSAKKTDTPQTPFSLRTKAREAVDYSEKKIRVTKNSAIVQAANPEEILNGLDLTGVPSKLSDIVEVRTSTIPNAGRGLFATRNLPMTTPLGFYFGVPTLEHEFDLYKDNVGKASHYSMRYRHTILDATDAKGEPFTDPNGKIFCPFHFMNEDPFGNMVFLEGNEVNQVICWTKRDILKGEELFVYYGGEVDRGHWGAETGQKSDGSEEQEFQDDESSEDEDQEDEEVLNSQKRKRTEGVQEIGELLTSPDRQKKARTKSNGQTTNTSSSIGTNDEDADDYNDDDEFEDGFEDHVEIKIEVD